MQPFGYDFGTRPKVMVVGDGEFPSLLRRGLVALGYGKVPQFGVLVNIPLLNLGFKDEAIGRECFEHFKRWNSDSRDGDAVRLSFIEFETGEYGLCISQDQERLIHRYLSEQDEAEVDPLLMIVGHLKMFQRQSDAYHQFKREVKSSPCVVALGTHDGKIPIDFAFWKREINFYREQEVPDQTIERTLLKLHDGDEVNERPRPVPTELRPSVQELLRRRFSQLARFFPVTQELLNFSPAFRQAKQELLSEGYREWQVIQAGCNISLRTRLPDPFPSEDESSGELGDGTIKLKLLYFLLEHVEELPMSLPSNACSKINLRTQILADSSDLLSYVTAPDVPAIADSDLQQELAKRGLV